MSNIQITENESGKYSPEWFYNESQTPEWISFAHKADELRGNFINLFGIEHLKSLSGKDLLTSLFYNDEGNKTNLCYMLEMDKEIREVFGSISGGAAYKFGLFYHKKNQSWTLFCYFRMYSALTDTKLPGLLADRSLMFDDIIGDLNCTFFNIFFHTKPLHSSFFTIYAGAF